MIETQDYRYERKFLVNHVSYQAILRIIKMNSASFTELYPSRNINNIYFDDNALTRFHDNVDGIAERQKVRIRWYGKVYGRVLRPVLEIKNRKNSVGTKLSFELFPADIDHNTDARSIREVISNSEISELIKTKMMLLTPKIFNGYTRDYYISRDTKFRVTIDTNLYYTKFNQFKNSFKEHFLDKNNVVIELKYDHDSDYLADTITNQFGFRLTKNSKYVNGIYALYY
jgi:SPX domain protein involved in polyphosphate accumulation